MRRIFISLLSVLAAASWAAAQSENGQRLPLAQSQGTSAAPVVITLQDALQRARNLDADVQSAIADVKSAGEERVQAKASLLPGVSATSQYLGTQGNGINPSGRYVSNDGVHLYRDWAVVHEEVTAGTFRKTGSQRADASEILAKAKVEGAQRGLAVTVTKNYYAMVTAQRKYANAQLASQEADRFLERTRQQERLGEVAHYDVVKAQLQSEDQQQSFDEAALAMATTRLSLAVLVFPALNENFTVVDDLESGPTLPSFDDARTLAGKDNPEIRAALQAVRQANKDTEAARNARLPNLSVDFTHGIEANAFALHSTVAAFPEGGILPNLGYGVVANLTIPVFDWGAQKSKVRQAQLRETQLQTQATAAQRQIAANLQLNYDEAVGARAAVNR
ncbi:MAG TPA: TolC family protein, partial [Terriglobia bacterium]|nr:TolC family protein [Terriglobia bacterium]